MKYEVCKAYKNTYVRTVDSWEEVMEFVRVEATENNYGMYRYWEMDGVTYFDCGPTVYTVKEV